MRTTKLMLETRRNTEYKGRVAGMEGMTDER